MQLWLIEAESRLPPTLIGKRIIDGIPLGSKLSALVAHLSVDEICAAEGYKAIVRIIEEAHEYLRDQRLEQSFDEAIFRGKRDRGQSITNFLSSKKAAFAEFRKQGLDLLETKAGRHLLGHLILRQGNFSTDQKHRLKVVTDGSIDYQEIEKAIQKIFGDKLDEVGYHEQAQGSGGGGRWRRSFWESGPGDGDYEAEYPDESYEGVYYPETAHYGEEIEYEDYLFEDLLDFGDLSDEPHMIFTGEVPTVMDEDEALEIVSNYLEETLYEVRDRMKGKGHGKKGKGKGKFGARNHTFGTSPQLGGGRGGYLETRGFDRPWQQKGGKKGSSRASLSEIKSKTRCHQCKQIGHWSRECPQRKKFGPGPPFSPTRPTVQHTSGSPMSTGFFHGSSNHSGGDFFEPWIKPERGSGEFSALSYVYMARDEIGAGTALVDTAAQHGLVGSKTLQRHDALLQQMYGLQVQHSPVDGGKVRGVCGMEEKTGVAYVPIGLAGNVGC